MADQEVGGTECPHRVHLQQQAVQAFRRPLEAACTLDMCSLACCLAPALSSRGHAVDQQCPSLPSMRTLSLFRWPLWHSLIGSPSQPHSSWACQGQGDAQDAMQSPELVSAPSGAGDSVRTALGHALRQLGDLGLWRSGRASHPLCMAEAVVHMIQCPLK